MRLIGGIRIWMTLLVNGGETDFVAWGGARTCRCCGECITVTIWSCWTHMTYCNTRYLRPQTKCLEAVNPSQQPWVSHPKTKDRWQVPEHVSLVSAILLYSLLLDDTYLYISPHVSVLSGIVSCRSAICDTTILLAPILYFFTRNNQLSCHWAAPFYSCVLS